MTETIVRSTLGRRYTYLSAGLTLGVAAFVDATVSRGHQHATGARHALPQDIPVQRLASLLEDPEPTPEPNPESEPASCPEPSAAPGCAGDTGGWVE